MNPGGRSQAKPTVAHVMRLVVVGRGVYVETAPGVLEFLTWVTS